MAAEQSLNPESLNSCCAEWKKKCSKIQEARNALRQAVKLLEQRVNEVEAQNVNLKNAYLEEQAQTKIEKEEKLKESEARVSLENEVSALKSEITRLQQKCGADAQQGNGDVKVLQACISDRETEINRLKELLEREKMIADTERKIAEKEKKKAAEAWELLEAEKNKSVEKGKQLARIEAEKAEEYKLQQAHLVNEVNDTKKKLTSEVLKFKEATKMFEAEKQKLVLAKRNAELEMAKVQERLEVEKQKAAMDKRHADVELVKVEEQKKLAEDNWKRAMEAKHLADQMMSQKLVEDKQTIEDLKQKLVLEKRNAESEMAKVQERLEVEKQKAASDKRRADAELVKVEEQKKLAEDNWKRAMEAKHLADQMMSQKLVEDKQTIEDLKQKLVNAESEMAKVQERLEVEKQKAAMDKRHADVELVKVEEQKKLAEDNWKRAMEAKHLADQMSQKLVEDKQTIEDLKQKLVLEKRNAESEMAKVQERLEVEKQKAARDKRRADAELVKVEEQKKLAEDNWKRAMEAKHLADQMMSQKLVEDKQTIEDLKQKLVLEKRNAESEMAKVQEKLEVEKQKAASDKRRADAELVKVEEQKKLAEDNWKRAMEAKHLADQMMSQKLVEDKQTIEDLKQKLVLEKRNAESEMAKVQEKLEVEKQKAASDKRRADAELVKVEEQKKLAEDNWKRAMEAKHLADQMMSQKLVEDKQTIEDLKQKIKLEKLRAKNARKKFKLEASRCSILQHELGCLKLNIIQLIHRLDMLDASFSPVTRSIHGVTKSQNMPNMQKSKVMSQVFNPDMSQMHSRVENELLEPRSTSMDACDPLRKTMQNTPLLALSGGNCVESITGIDSKLQPLIRDSNRVKLQSSAGNSNTASFSDGQLMGSQERGSLQVIASTKLAQENLNARPSMSNPSDRSVIEHDRNRKRIFDTVECIANLSSEGKKLNMQVDDKLCDLRGLLYRKMDNSVEGGREMVSNHKDNLLAKSDRAHKKRKKSHSAKADIYMDGKKGTKETKVVVYEDANGCGHTPCPASYTPRTTQACRERIFDAPNKSDSMISFDEVDDGNFMKLLDFENAADEECHRRAMDVPLSPSLPEIETFDGDNLKPFLEEALHEDLLSQRNPFPSTRCDVIDVEINSNEQKFDAFTVPSNTHHKPTQARKTDEKVPDMHASERAAFLAEAGMGSLNNQLLNFCFVLSDIEDNSSISRTFRATKNCIARCSLDTQTEWAVASILTAVEIEEMPLEKEKHSVLLTLLLFNFTRTAAMKFGKLWNGNLVLCLNSYAEHILRVMTDAATRLLFLEKISLHELLCLIEDFLVDGKFIFKNKIPTETLSESDLRTNNFLEGADTLSFEVASSEQLVAASIILASLCAATDHVGFICEASYNILRLCRWDSLTVLAILHIFANLGGRKFFDLGNFHLMVTVLKSLVVFLEDGSISVTTASCLPSINHMHTELCTSAKCPFSEGAESIDIVTLLLLEKIKNCLLQRGEQFDSSNFGFLSDSYNDGQRSNQEAVQCASRMNCDVPCCLKKLVICPTQPDILINVTLCQLSDVLSLLELVANKMSWQWTNVKLVPELLNMLDSSEMENFSVAIIILLGQLGRLGVNVGGYEDRGVENLRCNLFSYLCNNSSVKAGLSLQIATATALFGLLPLDFETLLQTKFSLPACSNKSVSDGAENLRKWFSGLGKDQQELVYGILRSTDVY